MFKTGHGHNGHSQQSGRNLTTSFRGKVIVVAIVTLVFNAVLLLYGLYLTQRIGAIESQWEEYNRKAAKSSYHLSRIESNFGYGGFIHNYKNYVLRRDASLTPRIEISLRDTYKSLELYRDVHLTTHHGDDSELHAIEDIINKYAANFALAKQLVAEGKSSEGIDALVRVNDQPALAALRHLQDDMLLLSREQEQRTNDALHRTIGYLRWGVLLFPLSLVAAWVVLYLLRQTVNTSNVLQETGEYLSDLFEAAPDAMLIVDKTGRIREANKRAVELFGYEHGELEGMKVESLMPERYRNWHRGIRDESFNDPVRRPFMDDKEFVAETKDGKEIPIEISLNYTVRGNEPQAITTLRDISQRKESEDIVRHNAGILKKAQQIANLGSWEWDIETNTIIWSDEMFHIFGLEPQSFEPTYDAFLDAIHPDDKENVVNAVNASVVYDEPYSIEHRVVNPNGSVRIVQERGDVFRDKAGAARYMVGIVHDISELKQAEAELKMADNVFSHTAEAIMITNSHNRILRINEAFTRITGYEAIDVVGKRPNDVLKSGQHDADFYKTLWQSLNDDSTWEGEILDRRQDGTVFPAWHSISVVRDDQGDIIQHISIFSDITEKKNAEAYIQNLAQYDQLTGLPNRMLFNDRLEHACSRSERTGVRTGLMFIDLDRFKNVNDTLGHQAGDYLLQEVAKRLTDTVRAQDTVARLGGDEFTVILEDLAHPEDAGIVAEKLLQALAKTVDIDGQAVVTGGSIGIGIFPDDGDDTESLVKHADMAMYQAKQQGRNRYKFYTIELAEYAETRFHIENRLRHALDNHELELYYQPQVDVTSGELIGAEALLRWNDPEKGLVMPDKFIDLAEETGLIEPIGAWVLEAACLQARAWQEDGHPPLRMTVNVSGYQITHSAIVETVENALKATGLDPQYLELEITESFVMEHTEKVISTLNQLRGLGVSLAIDDFGTGYSSLSYLKRLSIDRLKIDRSFVMDIPDDKDDEAIVATIIAMSKNLGLYVIAEGVEKQEQIDFLREHGCVEMQGYYFSKPVPREKFLQQFQTPKVMHH